MRLPDWLRLQVGSVSYDREGVADHAKNLAANVRGNLRRSLEAIGVVRLANWADAPSAFGLVSPSPLDSPDNTLTDRTS